MRLRLCTTATAAVAHTTYLSTAVSSGFGLLWLLVYYDVAGLRSAWFSIFVDVDVAFARGLKQVLISMAILEVARPGLETTTYELFMSLCNGGNAGDTSSQHYSCCRLRWSSGRSYCRPRSRAVLCSCCCFRAVLVPWRRAVAPSLVRWCGQRAARSAPSSPPS